MVKNAPCDSFTACNSVNTFMATCITYDIYQPEFDRSERSKNNSSQLFDFAKLFKTLRNHYS